MGMNASGSDDREWALNIMHWLSGLLAPPASPAGKTASNPDDRG